MCHFCCLWNGMFDCHQVEITVMQFTGHSLPVHQSVSVPWDFNPVPHVSQARLCQWNMQLPHLLNGMSGRVEGQYTTKNVAVSQKPSDRKQEWHIPKERGFRLLKRNSFTLAVTTPLKRTYTSTAVDGEEHVSAESWLSSTLTPPLVASIAEHTYKTHNRHSNSLFTKNVSHISNYLC